MTLPLGRRFLCVDLLCVLSCLSMSLSSESGTNTAKHAGYDKLFSSEREGVEGSMSILYTKYEFLLDWE